MQNFWQLVAILPLLVSPGFCQEDAQIPPPPVVADLGIESRYPSKEEAAHYQLETRVRHRGQIVTTISRDGPADRAGLRAGDVIERMDGNDIYSADDIADFVSTASPRQKVRFHVVRGKHRKQIDVVLGKKELPGDAPRFRWQFAGLVQLDYALGQARREGKPVLIGISGAET